jgi:hypothetical protein
MTLIEQLAGFLREGTRARPKAPSESEKRTQEGMILRREIDVLFASANEARSNGDRWSAAQSLERASRKLDTAGAIRRAIEVRRDAASEYTKFAEAAESHAEVVAGYTHAARALLVAGDIDAAKASADCAQDARPKPAASAGSAPS